MSSSSIAGVERVRPDHLAGVLGLCSLLQRVDDPVARAAEEGYEFFNVVTDGVPSIILQTRLDVPGQNCWFVTALEFNMDPNLFDFKTYPFHVEDSKLTAFSWVNRRDPDLLVA